MAFECDEKVVEKLVDSQILRLVELSMLFCSILAVPVLCYMFLVFKNSTSFHFNIRLIGAFHCVFLLIHCVARIFQHGADVWLYSSKVPVCEKIPSITRCFSTRVPYIFGLFCASYSTVFMVVERTIATNNYRKYENRRKRLGLCLLVGQFLVGATTTFAILSDFDFERAEEFCTSGKSSNPYNVIIPELVAMCSNFVAFLQFTRLIRINKEIRVGDTSTNLSQKYQVEENLSVIKILKALTQCDFVFIVIYFALGIPFHFFGHNMSHAEYYALFEVIYFVPLYSLIMPALIYRFTKKQREKRANRVERTINTSREAYFQFIHNQWT